MRNVIYLGSTAGPPRTGGERYDLEILSFLQNNGWSTNCLAPPSSPGVPFLLRHTSENFWFLREVLRLADARTVVLEDLHLHSRTLLLNLYLRAGRRTQLLGILHHLPYHDLGSRAYRAIDRALVRLSLSLMHHVIAISQSTKQSLSSLGMPSDRIHVVLPNATELPHPVRSPLNDGTLHALFVGTCCPRKGVDHLVRAMGQLRDCPLTVHVVGDLAIDADYAQGVVRLAHEMGLGDRVVFHGRISQESLHEQYARADMFVLPSLWEGYGIVLIEATAFGLPIVATSVGAVPEIVQDGYNGLLVPPSDAGALAAALRRVCTDVSLRQSLATGCLERRRSLRTWDSVGKEFADLLDRIAS
ncbi:MAG: glycosyltransferase family 4 protein [Chloroflexi bacterium]|nr:glycosyltransferase family 4 protein [Chloroflexota bacterium]